MLANSRAIIIIRFPIKMLPLLVNGIFSLFWWHAVVGCFDALLLSVKAISEISGIRLEQYTTQRTGIKENGGNPSGKTSRFFTNIAPLGFSNSLTLIYGPCEQCAPNSMLRMELPRKYINTIRVELRTHAIVDSAQPID